MSAAEWGIIALSLRVALLATLLCLPFALGAAWLLARHDFRGKMLFDAMVHLPLILPPVLIGWLLLISFGQQGFAGKYLYELIGIRLVFDYKGAALAAAIMALPLMVRAFRLAIEAVDPKLEQAAASMGLSRLQMAAQIILPLSLPGLLAGLLLGFARAMGEFGATVAFAGNMAGETRTLSLAIYSAMQQPDGEQMLLRLAVFSILISFAALLIADYLARRVKRGQGL